MQSNTVNQKSYDINTLSTSTGSKDSLTNESSSTLLSLLRSHQKMHRRRAGVSRKYEFPSKCSTIEEPKRRRIKRRYAITKYSQIPQHSMKALRSLVDDDDVVEAESVTTSYINKPINHFDKVIVFDENDNLQVEYEGSQHFLALIRAYYEESYQEAFSDAHKSIIRSSIFQEIQDQGYTFIKKSVLNPGTFFTVEDIYALVKIKQRLEMHNMAMYNMVMNDPGYAHSA
eukprot:40183_1